MHRLSTFCCVFGLAGSLALAPLAGHAQTGIGTTSPHPSARLDVTATNRGLLVPRLTTAQRDAITAPAQGLMIYNTDLSCFNYYDVSAAGWLGINCDATPSTALGTLTCEAVSVAGSYRTGVALTAGNTLSVPIIFTTLGTYKLTATANGMTFRASGTVTTLGATTITLAGSGVPELARTTLVPVTYNGATCPVSVVVADGQASLAACPTAGTASGSLAVGVAATGVTVPLTVAYTGGTSYALTGAGTVGGLTLGAVSGTLGASPASVTVAVTGTPVVPGPTALPYTLNNQSGCTATVTVTSGTGRASAVDCGGALSGPFAVGTALTGSSSKSVTVTVSTAGTFVLRTGVVNGVSFEAGPVSLGVGSQVVSLTAVGTPAAAGSFVYPVQVSSSATGFVSCSFTVNYIAGGGANYTNLSCTPPGVAYAYVKASNTGASDQFGQSVALSADGLTLAMGALSEDGSGTGINPADNNAAANAGAVYVYTRASVASAWTFQAYVKASNTGASDQFGWAVALSADGNTLVVGAYGEDGSGTGINPASNEAATDAGAMYIYSRTGSTWTMATP